MRHRFDPISFTAGLIAVALGLTVLIGGRVPDPTDFAWDLIWPAALVVIALYVVAGLRPRRRPAPEAPAPAPADPLDPFVAEALRELDSPEYDPLAIRDLDPPPGGAQRP